MNTLRKLYFIVLSSLLLTGCSPDYSTSKGFKNGYTYEHWGNNFIARTVNGEMRQIVEGQVVEYSISGDYIIADQEGFEGGDEVYWLVNMETHQKKSFQTANERQMWLPISLE